MPARARKAPYAKPELVKHANVREITFSGAGWTCSICGDSSSDSSSDGSSDDSS